MDNTSTNMNSDVSAAMQEQTSEIILPAINANEQRETESRRSSGHRTPPIATSQTGQPFFDDEYLFGKVDVESIVGLAEGARLRILEEIRELKAEIDTKRTKLDNTISALKRTFASETGDLRNKLSSLGQQLRRLKSYGFEKENGDGEHNNSTTHTKNGNHSPDHRSAAPSRPYDESKRPLDNAHLYKTKLCKNYKETGKCQYGENCAYAHGQNELNDRPRSSNHDFIQNRSAYRDGNNNARQNPPDDNNYKTKLCINFAHTNSCIHGESCLFAHGLQELRVAGRTNTSHRDPNANNDAWNQVGPNFNDRGRSFGGGRGGRGGGQSMNRASYGLSSSFHGSFEGGRGGFGRGGIPFGYARGRGYDPATNRH